MITAIKGIVSVPSSGDTPVKIRQAKPVVVIDCDGEITVTIVITVWDRSSGKICFTSEAGHKLTGDTDGEQKDQWTVDTVKSSNSDISLTSQIEVTQAQLGIKKLSDCCCIFLVKIHKF
jgi:hypothetical protein